MPNINLTLSGITHTTATITWTDATGVTGYGISHKSGANAYVRIATVVTGSGYYIDTLLARNTSYGFFVSGFTGVSGLNVSGEVSGFTLNNNGYVVDDSPRVDIENNLQTSLLITAPVGPIDTKPVVISTN